MLKIRDSRAVHFARTNQTLLLALTCMVVVAILSIVALPGAPPTVAEPGTSFPTTPTSEDYLADATTAPAATSTAGTTVALAPTTTPTDALIGPDPGRSTAIPTQELPNSVYPPPGDDPSGVGEVPPTEFPFPFPEQIDPNQPLPTFPAFPDPPPSNTGQTGRVTAVPENNNQTEPTQPTGGYPPPGNNQDQPTAFPEPTLDPGGGRATDVPESTNPTIEPPGGIEPTLDIPIPTLDIPIPTLDLSTPVPTIPPTPAADTISGDVRWTAAQSPVLLRRDTIVAAGSRLTIDPGVEVKLGSDVSLVVDGTLLANGSAANPVRWRKADDTNWRSIVVNAGGRATLSGVDVRGGGAGGVLIAALGGNTVIEDSVFEQNRGQILGSGGSLDIQRSSIAGIAPIVANVPGGGKLRLIGNSINNTSSDGATGVAISAAATDVTIDIQKNLFRGTSGTNVRAQFEDALSANFQCNTFSSGAVGLSIKSRNPTLDGSRIVISNNSFLNHKTYGLAADIGLDARNNWWGHPSGPYHPQQNGSGTGDAVGINLPFIPWLQSRPACTP
ncbi:MAG: hypothetical protein H0T53_13305 [Herpetosiphonaceae bacterium]|nr:hypothetical protein [Herpetosiphonaceae bacterium]